MRELAIVVANTRDIKTKSNYCSSKKNKKEIATKRTRLFVTSRMLIDTICCALLFTR